MTKTFRPVELNADARDPGITDAASNLDVAAILTLSGEAAYEWQIASDALTWSDNAPALLGLHNTRAISTGRHFAMLLDTDNATTRADAVTQSAMRDLGAGVAYQIQYAIRTRPRGPKLWIEDTGRWFAGKDGKPERAQGLIRVINDRREHEEHLAYLSRFDPLTGEINRWHLTEQLEKRLEEATRTGTDCSVLLVAIDNLGRINEAYGYEIADEVIGIVARRLRSTMRSDDCLGRFSGNKFALVLRDCSPDEIGIAAERFLGRIRHDVIVTTGGPISVTGTIGGVVAPRHARDVHDVLSRAQEALDLAKEKRPGSFLVYQPNAERDVMRRENIRATDRIVTALNQQRIVLAYEPVVDAHTRDGAFYECLLRIQGVDGEMISASDIMPVAERLGIVRLLDQRMLELALSEMVANPELRASVNVSASSTLDPDWWAQLEAMLKLHTDVAERLIVEITETVAIHDIDNARGFVARVKDLGARIAIDDFGAGNTSFRNLRKLGVDMIKIDGAFIKNLAHSSDDRTFVRAMLELAHGLKLQSVAEWVQDAQTAAMLAAWGCDYLQGEYIGQARFERPIALSREKRAAKV